MRLIQSLLFVICLAATLALAAGQQPDRSQETVNAIHEQQLARIELTLVQANSRVDKLEKEVADQKSTQDKIIGLGVGIGVTLTTLQALMVILTFKNGGKRG